MFPEFKIIENLPEESLEFEDVFYFGKTEKRKLSWWEQFFYCSCQHIYYSHQLAEGKCSYPNCDCQQLIFVDADLDIIFTSADRFELENPDHSERDSPNWWIEYSQWKK
jgi:hypothetical protein